jgi:hypothetical protein
VVLVEWPIEKGLCRQRGIRWQSASTKDDAVRPNETEVTDCYWRRRLTAGFEIDTMRQDLRLEPRECCKPSDDNPTRAIDQMAIRNRRVFCEDEFRSALVFVREVTGQAARETRDPIAASNPRVGVHVNQVEILADGECSNLGAGLHHQSLRPNPSESNPGAGMNLIAEAALE